MSRLWLWASAVLLAINLSSGLLAGFLGQANPAPAALAGFSVGCEAGVQPCWYGLVPGQTRLAEAEAILARLDYRNSLYAQLSYIKSGTWCQIDIAYDGGSTIVNFIGIRPCEPLQLGDLLPRLPDEPYWMVPDCSRFQLRNQKSNWIVFLETPDPLTTIDYFILMEAPPEPVGENNWHGFAARWQYPTSSRTLFCGR